MQICGWWGEHTHTTTHSYLVSMLAVTSQRVVALAVVVVLAPSARRVRRLVAGAGARRPSRALLPHWIHA